MTRASLTHATHPNIAAGQIHPFMATVFPYGSDLLQQDDVLFIAKKI